jgi:hypothetical protein
MRTDVTRRGRCPVRRGGSAQAGRAATVAVAFLVLTLAPAASAGADPSPADASSTTTVPVTTTVPSTTTTTVPTTTTTVAPTTTSTIAVPRTTTSSSSTTTTTLPPATTTSSSTPWGLIALIVVLVVAVLVVALLLRSRKKKATEVQWRRVVVPALSDAQLARESLLSGNALSADAELRGAVSVQAERAAVALDHAASTAPDPQAAATASGAAGALRGLAFAIEADRLLRQGSSAPTGIQLAQADEARRARQAELNTALARLSARIGSASHSAT